MTGSLIDSITIVKQDATVIISFETKIPAEFTLHQNYPNPFNPITTIQYELPQRLDVQITIYDMLGRKVHEFIAQKQLAGNHSIQWSGKDINGNPVSAGIYFYQLKAGDYVQTKKMLLMK